MQHYKFKHLRAGYITKQTYTCSDANQMETCELLHHSQPPIHLHCTCSRLMWTLQHGFELSLQIASKSVRFFHLTYRQNDSHSFFDLLRFFTQIYQGHYNHHVQTISLLMFYAVYAYRHPYIIKYSWQSRCSASYVRWQCAHTRPPLLHQSTW